MCCRLLLSGRSSDPDHPGIAVPRIRYSCCRSSRGCYGRGFVAAAVIFAQAPRRWFWVFMLTLLAHPLVDAFTVYGTQLLWPLPVRPLMWSSVFIIDPMFTVWLALACAVAWVPADAGIGATRAGSGDRDELAVPGQPH